MGEQRERPGTAVLSEKDPRDIALATIEAVIYDPKYGHDLGWVQTNIRNVLKEVVVSR